MEYALQIKNLTKKYDDFVLDNINITLPHGSIMGFIGENGAGKSTVIKLILSLISRDSGSIKVLGTDSIADSVRLKEKIGVVMDESGFPENLNAKNINMVMKRMYSSWHENIFCEYLRRFSLPYDKPLKDFSKGMKMKINIAAALSHDAKLLIMDVNCRIA